MPVERRRTRLGPVVTVLVLLAVVLLFARTPPGTSLVTWLHGFLEFFSGAFALVALSAATVAGTIAAQQSVPARLRILMQAAHRATALMAVAFLAAHILLKVMEAHATALDTLVPFLDGQDRALYVGLGTIASDLMIIIVATGVMRGRFAGHRRPWVWRTVHGLAYAAWPVAIIHGLLAGRTPKLWVTLSYLVCLGVVAVAILARLPRLIRRRKLTGTYRHAPRSGTRAPGAARTGASGASRGSGAGGDGEPAAEVPDEQFWRLLRAEAKQWMGNRR
jgi:DMSO/TMAO reductase YedYZ heme-binding membrane subunit